MKDLERVIDDELRVFRVPKEPTGRNQRYIRIEPFDFPPKKIEGEKVMGTYIDECTP